MANKITIMGGYDKSPNNSDLSRYFMDSHLK